jgi:hypothetical protein
MKKRVDTPELVTSRFWRAVAHQNKTEIRSTVQRTVKESKAYPAVLKRLVKMGFDFNLSFQGIEHSMISDQDGFAHGSVADVVSKVVFNGQQKRVSTRCVCELASYRSGTLEEGGRWGVNPGSIKFL